MDNTYDTVDQQYHTLTENVLREGAYKPNRTGVDTISGFSQHYRIDLSDGYPLLTTKDLSGFRWDSLIHEFLWYLSGQEHIRDLREETGIWDAWADEEGHLDTAYGRFWRRYPVPGRRGRLDGEMWPDGGNRWVTEEEGRLVFDQLGYVLDTLRENPNSRRMVVNAWHPANAAVSTLPPCHYTFVFNVQGDRLNVHLTQRSGDIALGIPFNIAAYALLTRVVAQQTGFNPGVFGHTIVDAHVYCGQGDRGAWYAENLDELSIRLAGVEQREGYQDVREWVDQNAPDPPGGDVGYDHVPGLLLQLSRVPESLPEIEVADKPLDQLEYEDIQLRNYEPHAPIGFNVAE